MTLEAMSRSQLAARLQIADEEGGPIDQVVADILRAPLSRWGLSPRRAVLRVARDQLRAAGLDTACVTRLLDQLIALGECAEVYVGHELYLAPAESRWLRVGEASGVLLAISGPPEGVLRAQTRGGRDIVQRIQINSDDDVARLQLAGVREISIEEWLMPIGYLEHTTRRLRRSARSDAVTLESFWSLLEDSLANEGLPLSEDADVRVVAGEPGGFFGNHSALEPEGRWSSEIPEGTWCGIRRGYGEEHWHPMIVSVAGQQRRALDLFDMEEWRWALLARGRSCGSEEAVLASSGSVRLTFPAPRRLRAAMDLVGTREAAWNWSVRAGAPDVWALVE